MSVALASVRSDKSQEMPRKMVKTTGEGLWGPLTATVGASAEDNISCHISASERKLKGQG